MKTVASVSSLPEVLCEIPSCFTLISRVMFGSLFDIRSVSIQACNMASRTCVGVKLTFVRPIVISMRPGKSSPR